MTKEEIMELSAEEIETRKAEIREEIKAASDPAALDALDAEVSAIEERVAQLKEEHEERKAREEREAHRADIAAVLAGSGKTIEKMEERKTMTNMEIRNTKEYIDAFAKYVKTGNDKECRSLLTENASGTIPVPELVYGIVAERVKASRILSRVRRMNVKGNVKVGFEIAAPEAAIHEEGTAAVTEEALTLGIVTLIPGAAKKWVQFSDEVADNSEAFLTYIYDELTRGIIKAREKAIIDAILTAPQTATATAPAVAKTGSAAGAITDFVDARALLSGAAEDLVIIVSPADYATYRGLQMSASYGVDPFDGREVIISEYATKPIIGDLAGAMENLPNGDDIEFKYDDLTLMTSDMVRLLGRQPVASGVVGNLFFAKVSA
ncbi:MAG: phage major capsid protein [Clostridia bacterium]|nr:phage major capsid protein [Clostridia bacterium]